MLQATRRFGIIVGLLLTVAFLTGCAAHVTSPVTGVLYTDVKGADYSDCQRHGNP